VCSWQQQAWERRKAEQLEKRKQDGKKESRFIPQRPVQPTEDLESNMIEFGCANGA
jgi:hypothetical protein